MNLLEQSRYDSRTWTGLYHQRYQWGVVRVSHAFHHRSALYLRIGIKKAAHKVFQHGWNWHWDACDVCGLTREEQEDHSWRALPRGVAVRV